MASENKKKKLKNSFGAPSVLKEKGKGPKRWIFFTSAYRQELKRKSLEEV
jgi:hypothetical protein